MPIRVRIRIEGADEVLRALDKLPADARHELKDKTQKVSEELARKIKAAGRARGRQARRAASTVKAIRSATPTVQATHPGKRTLLGSEFGMTRHSGWYAAGRYSRERAHQFYPHSNAGYWFFPTARAAEPEMARQWNEIAAAVVRKWSA